MRCEGMEWIHLAQDSVQWRDPVNMIPQITVNFLST
jgi:hypothetical protein